MRLISPAFSDGGPIARAHTCDGADLSPPLVWTGIPASARELAITMNESGEADEVFTHWVLYGLSPTVSRLASGVPNTERVEGRLRAFQGSNDHRRIGYRGPCPAPGLPHTYVFTLFALDRTTHLPPGANRSILFASIEGGIIEIARLTGTYGRSQSR